MSRAARQIPDRPDRYALNRGATLRDAERIPQDVVIENLSTTGCLLRIEEALPSGTAISIGIAGVGVVEGRIGRVEGAGCACVFARPLADADVQAALAADGTVLHGTFQRMPAPGPWDHGSAAGRGAFPKLPLRVRLAIIIGLSVLLWAVLIGVGYWLLH